MAGRTKNNYLGDFKMKLKLGLLLMYCLPLMAFADVNDDSRPMDLSKLPQPDSGVKVVPASQMNFTEKENKEFALRLQEQKTRGYVELSTESPKKLLKMSYYGKLQLESAKKINDPQDSHLKHNYRRC